MKLSKDAKALLAAVESQEWGISSSEMSYRPQTVVQELIDANLIVLVEVAPGWHLHWIARCVA